ncbi:hypothetical protein BDV27DRAFT_156788 [Aspergillus caelatus]|uniref:Uncharacterized protein n=2 Tax=Aspergillus subgen. Circumdati TaxID=2720871 RepID=A0A5N7A7L2_9EURO|nr:uncharacterized protein BDV27DRAFT_156788 [Aspergillus caelatus]KAE8365603.1 hypothetical protein BDV27DRAFT_156788 [Aspergillus caelatus]KAE8421662.1 hypothetical protein BDV36DRAFT_292046 [Aspergillus pseudocaelatus]
MSNWPIFITAPEAPIKTINKALLHLTDYEFNCPPQWTLLLTRAPTEPTTPSIPPLPIEETAPTVTTNEFAFKSPDEIYTYLDDPVTQGLFKDRNLSTSNWLIIDQKGLEMESCLLVEYMLPEDREDEEGNGEGYRMCRIPWTRAWGMFCNLDIGNMGFEEWVDEERGPVEEDFGAWAWVGPFEGEDMEDMEVKRKREEAVRRGVEEGWA